MIPRHIFEEFVAFASDSGNRIFILNWCPLNDTVRGFILVVGICPTTFHKHLVFQISAATVVAITSSKHSHLQTWRTF